MSKTVPSADEARHRLYEIMKQDGEFETKATEALELGTTYLGVDSAFVTRVDPDTDHWETIVSTDGRDGLVPTGATKDLSGTYCRHTLERDSPLAVHDIPDSDELDDEGGFQCYHGTTLTVDSAPYGTVCFVARTPREQPFDEAETMFAELVGRLLEHELEHRRQQEELARQTSMINVLDRVLRHNIRNDTTVIRAMGEILKDQREDCEQCRTIIERADDLVATSETARHLGKLINEGGSRRPVDIAALVEQVAADAREEYPGARITTETPDRLVVHALPSLETALRELLENAATHTGEAPRVHVSAAETDDCVELTVSDDGPGMPETETDVLQTGTETQLVHGSGLGLWSVYWIVTSHGGDIDIATDDGTRVRLLLPSETTRQAGEPEVPRAVDRYRAAFADAPVGLVVLDDDGRIVETNDWAEELLDHADHGIAGHRFDAFCAEESEGAALSGAPATGQRGQIRLGDTVTGAETVTYAAVGDVVPGQHLVVLQEVEQ